MMNRLTEKVLFEKLQQGDQKVLKNFFDDTFALFVAFAQDFLGRDDACEDIVQDTFVTFWEQKESFENIYYVKAFFYKTIRHKCLNHIRHQRIALKYVNSLQKAQGELESTTYYVDAVIQEEASRMVYEEILKLSEVGRQVMLLALEGFSNDEIAEKLGISVNTVRTHKARAYQYLRGRLNELRILLLLLQPW